MNALVCVSVYGAITSLFCLCTKETHLFIYVWVEKNYEKRTRLCWRVIFVARLCRSYASGWTKHTVISHINTNTLKRNTLIFELAFLTCIIIIIAVAFGEMGLDDKFSLNWHLHLGPNDQILTENCLHLALPAHIFPLYDRHPWLHISMAMVATYKIDILTTHFFFIFSILTPRVAITAQKCSFRVVINKTFYGKWSRFFTFKETCIDMLPRIGKLRLMFWHFLFFFLIRCQFRKI